MEPIPEKMTATLQPSSRKLLLSNNDGIRAPVGWLRHLSPSVPGCLFLPWGRVVWALPLPKLDLAFALPFLAN